MTTLLETSNTTATLNKLLEQRSLNETEAQRLFDDVLSGQIKGETLGGILVALNAKGETATELTGLVRAMLRTATPADAPIGALDTCGTGGDKAGTFNISTATSLLLAALGVPIVKHANRSVTSRSGSADVFESLGIPLTVSHPRYRFLYAPTHHPALKPIGAVRRSLGVRTIFNFAGPPANPANPDFQLVGVSDRARLRVMAETLQSLGRQRAFVIHGEPGLDEATPAGPVTLLDVTADGIRESRIKAEDFGLPPCRLDELEGGGANENAAHIERIFNGDRGPKSDTVVMNAALGLVLTGRSRHLTVAARRAEAALDDGRAARLLKELRHG